MGTANPSTRKLQRSRPTRLSPDRFRWTSDSARAWNAIALAIHQQEHVLFCTYSDAVGIRLGTRTPVCGSTSPLWHPESRRLPTGRKGAGQQESKALLAGPPAVEGLQAGPALRLQSQKSRHLSPGPESHALHAVPSLGTWGLLWNMSKLSSHHAAICSPGAWLTWGRGAGQHLPVASRRDPGLLQELQAKEPWAAPRRKDRGASDSPR